MQNTRNSRRNATRTERQQQKIDAGLIAAQFPEVGQIVVNMMYNQKGIKKSLSRTVNFFPSSYAFFRVDCLSKDCLDGGFDLTTVITAMIGSRKKVAKGDLCCEGDSPSSDHSAIAYEVTIQYV